MDLEFFRQNIYFVILACASLAGFLYLTMRTPGSGRNSLTPAEATMKINREQAIVVDVREAENYAAGHLPESRSIPEARIDERLGDLQKLKKFPVILVCQAGTRSSEVRSRLEKEGFSEIYNLAGGINAWKAAGFPLKKGNKK